jgi:hypothetical protein
MGIQMYAHFQFIGEKQMVKKVFGTLAKVPCYIIIAYLIMNIVLFLGYYIKALGLSYAVMQIGVENNYIPDTEKGILTSTMSSIGSEQVYTQNDENAQNDKLKISAVSDFGFFIDTSGAKAITDLYPEPSVGAADRFKAGQRLTSTSDNHRKQYGNEITIGVGYIYHAVLPLPKSGSNGYTAHNEYSRDIAASGNMMEYTRSFVDTAVRISYKVPGLKYYPDL